MGGSMKGKCGYWYDYEKSVLDQPCNTCGEADCENNRDFHCADDYEGEEITLYCAECGHEITDEYYTYRDNFLQRYFFESSKENIFCSSECAAKTAMLESRLISVHGKPGDD
jgi:hypothetical protein